MPESKIRTVFVIPDEHFRISLYAELRRYNFLFCGEADTTSTGLSLARREKPNLVLIDFSLLGKHTVYLCQEIQKFDPSILCILIVDGEDPLPSTLMQCGVAGVVKRSFPHKAWPGVLAYIHAGGAVFSRSTLEQSFIGSGSAFSARRHKGFPEHTERKGAESAAMLTVGPLRLDLARRRVTLNNRRINLTPREYALLACLARNLDHVVTVDQLLNEVWGYNADCGEPSQVRMYIARLRRKLNPNEPDAVPIHTERGVGYRLTDRAAETAPYCFLPSLLDIAALEKAVIGFASHLVSAVRLRPVEDGQHGDQVVAPATSRVEHTFLPIKAVMNDWLQHSHIETIEEYAVALTKGVALVEQIIVPHVDTLLRASHTLALALALS